MEDQKPDAEYRSANGGFRIAFWRRGGVVISAPCGTMGDEDVEAVVKVHQDYLAKIGKRYPQLVDITSLEHISSQARRRMGALMTGPDSPTSRIAVVGGNIMVRTIFNIHGKISKIPMKMFASKEEALAWLESR